MVMVRMYFFWDLCVFLVQILTASIVLLSADGRKIRNLQLNTFANAPIHSRQGEKGAPPTDAGLGTPSLEPTFETLPIPAFSPYPASKSPPTFPCPSGFRIYPQLRDVWPKGTNTAAPEVVSVHPAAAASKFTLYYRDWRYPFYPFPYPVSIRCYPFPHIVRPLPSHLPRTRRLPHFFPLAHIAPAPAPAIVT